MSSAIGYKLEHFPSLRGAVVGETGRGKLGYGLRLLGPGGTVFQHAARADAQHMKNVGLPGILSSPAEVHPSSTHIIIPLGDLLAHHNRDFLYTDENNKAILGVVTNGLGGALTDSENAHRIRSSTIPGLLLAAQGYPDPRGLIRNAVAYNRREADQDLPSYYQMVEKNMYGGPDIDLVYEHPDYQELFEGEKTRLTKLYGEPYVGQDFEVVWKTPASLVRPPRQTGTGGFHRNPLEVRLRYKKTRSGIPNIEISLEYPTRDQEYGSPHSPTDSLLSIGMTPYESLPEEVRQGDVRSGKRVNSWDTALECFMEKQDGQTHIHIPVAAREIFSKPIEPGVQMEQLPPLALLEEILRVGRKGIEYAPLVDGDPFDESVFQRSQDILQNSAWRSSLYDKWRELTPERKSYYGAKFTGELVSMMFFDYQKAREYLIKTKALDLFPHLRPLADEGVWSRITNGTGSPGELLTSTVLRTHLPIHEITQLMNPEKGNLFARSRHGSPGAWWGRIVVDEFVKQNTPTLKVLADSFKRAGITCPYPPRAQGALNYLNYLVQLCAFDNTLL